ncbi:hypothetical protein [Providencia huashanensis]|uniref:hypothetical protein n=1 Tax=Providencia huashanensis TaxID=3037798 RepID=UPI002AFF51A3|nr:hypothetical protein [Providencia sp. 23021821]
MSKKMLSLIKKNTYVDEDSVKMTSKNSDICFFNFKNKYPTDAICDFLLLIMQRSVTGKTKIEIGILSLSSSFSVLCDDEAQKNSFTKLLQDGSLVKAGVDLSISLVETKNTIPNMVYSFNFTLNSSLPFIKEPDISDNIFSAQILSISLTFNTIKEKLGSRLICGII